MALQQTAQDLIFRLRVDAKDSKKTFKELEAEVKAFRETLLSTVDLTNGDFDEQRELLRAVNSAFKELAQTIQKEGDPPRNTLKGINREFEFIAGSLGALKQKSEDLKDAILVPDVNSKQYKDLVEELARVTAEVKRLEAQQKQAATEILNGAGAADKYTQALKESDIALRDEYKTITNVQQALKTTADAQKNFTAGSDEFQDLSKQYGDLSKALKDLQAAQKGTTEGERLQKSFEATGETAGLTIKELQALAKQFKNLAESADPASEEFAQIADELKTVQTALKAQQDALKTATTAQIDYNEALENSQKLIEDEATSLKDLQGALGDLKKAQAGLSVGSEEFEAVTAQIELYEKALQGVTKENKKVGEAFEDAANQIEEDAKGLGPVFDAIDDKLNGSLTSINEGFKGLLSGEGIGGLQDGIAQLGGNILKTLGPAGAIVGAVGAVGAVISDATQEINALRASVTNLGVSGDDIDKVTAKVAALGEQSGQDSAEIAKAANRIAQAYGISVTDALKQVEDGFTTNSSGAEAFLGAIQEFAPSIANAGIAAEDFGKLAGASLQAGIDPEKLAESFNEATIKIKDEGDATALALNEAFGSQFGTELIAKVQKGQLTVAEAFQKVTEEGAKFGEGSLQARKALVAVAGSIGEEGASLEQFNKALSGVVGGSLELTEAQKAQKAANEENLAVNEKYNASLNELGKAVSGPSKTFENLGTTLKTFVIDLFLELIPIGQKIFDSIKPLGNAFTKLGEAFGATGSQGSLLEGVVGVLAKVIEGLSQPIIGVANVVGTLANFVADGVKKFEELTGAISAGKEIFADVSNSINAIFGDEKKITAKADVVDKNVKRISDKTAKLDQEARDRAKAQEKADEKKKEADANALKAQEEYLASLKALREQARASEIANTNDRIKQIEFAQAEETKALKAQVGFRGLNEKEKNALVLEINRKFGKEKQALFAEQAQNEFDAAQKDISARRAAELSGANLTNEAREEIGRKFDAEQLKAQQDFLAERQKLLDKQVADNLLTAQEQKAQQIALDNERIALATQAADAEREARQRAFDGQTEAAQRAFDEQSAVIENARAKALQNTDLTAAELLAIEENASAQRIAVQKAFLAEQESLNKQAGEQGIRTAEEVKAEELRIQAEGNALLIEEADKLREKQNEVLEARKAQLEKTIGDTSPFAFEKRAAAINELYDLEIERARGNAAEIAKLNEDRKAAQSKNIQDTANTIKDVFGQASAEIENLFATIDAKRTEALDNEIAGIDESISKRQEALDKTKELEGEATGAKKAELRKQVKLQEAALAAEEEQKKKLEEEKAQIEKDAATRQKALAITQAIINTAVAVTAALTVVPPASFALAAITAALAGVQLAAIIAANVLEEGGDLAKITPATKRKIKAANGVVLKGASHAEGGIPAVSKAGHVLELEGDEIILTRGVKRNPALFAQASALNVAGGGIDFYGGTRESFRGVKFAGGGVVFDPTSLASGATSASQLAAAQTKQLSNDIGQTVSIALNSLPNPVVSVEEINGVNSRVGVIENNRRL